MLHRTRYNKSVLVGSAERENTEQGAEDSPVHNWSRSCWTRAFSQRVLCWVTRNRLVHDRLEELCVRWRRLFPGRPSGSLVRSAECWPWPHPGTGRPFDPTGHGASRPGVPWDYTSTQQSNTQIHTSWPSCLLNDLMSLIREIQINV